MLLVILNEELERNILWLQANMLTLKTQKSVFMFFHKVRLKSLNSLILINGTQLQEVSSTKYLRLSKRIDHIAHLKIKFLEALVLSLG